MNAPRSFSWGIFAGRTPILVMKFWPKKITKFKVRTEPPCGHTFTAGLELSWPTFPALNSENFPFFWFLFCSYRTRVIAFWTLVIIFQNVRNSLSGPGQPAGGWLSLLSFWRWLPWARQWIPQTLKNIDWSSKRSNSSCRWAIEEPQKRKIIRI